MAHCITCLLDIVMRTTRALIERLGKCLHFYSNKTAAVQILCLHKLWMLQINLKCEICKTKLSESQSPSGVLQEVLLCYKCL